MGDTTLFQVKEFLVADTPDMLVEAQLENNFTRGFKFKYDIIFDGSRWYAWFETNRKPKVIDDATE